MSFWTRRRWIQSVLAGSAGVALSRAVYAQDTKLPERSLQLFNTHTRETVNVVYKRGDAYDPVALAAFKNLLRDHRNGEAHDMDPLLFDQLYDLALAAHC